MANDLNPFGANKDAERGAVARTDEQRAIAEVQAAMMIARANPRDPVAATDRILNACTRPSLAASALYAYSRGGADITGPSIRLAEAIAQCWGNMQFGIREIEQRKGESVVQAYAWDVEANTRREVTFSVPHIRYTKKGSYDLDDPRDIYEAVANQGARRVRACLLAVIPGDVIEAAVSQCELTLAAKADTSPETVVKLLNAFAELGVTRAQIEARIQRRLDAIKPAQIISMKKIYASLRDGMSSVEDWFDAHVDAGEKVPMPQSASKAAGNKKGRPPAANAAPVEGVPAPEEGDPHMTYAQVFDALIKAPTDDARAVAADMIRYVVDEGQRGELTEVYRKMCEPC